MMQRTKGFVIPGLSRVVAQGSAVYESKDGNPVIQSVRIADSLNLLGPGSQAGTTVMCSGIRNTYLVTGICFYRWTRTEQMPVTIGVIHTPYRRPVFVVADIFHGIEGFAFGIGKVPFFFQ